MNEERDTSLGARASSGDHIGRLLRLAGPRPAVPQERAERVRGSVRAHWRGAVRARRRRRWLAGGSLGLAAALAVAGMIGLFYRPQSQPLPSFDGPVAEVVAVSGPVRLFADGRPGRSGEGRLLQPGDVIGAGGILDTGPRGRAAVRMASGSSLRLDHSTRLRGLTDVAVALDSGAIYFDSSGSAGTEPIEIRTPLGVVYDVGTLFEVRLGEREMRVRVREGAVHLDRDGRRHDAGPGIELTIDAGGALSRRSVPVFGPDWEWILAVAPSFELEGRTLDLFLDWVNRETGWRPRFVSTEAAARASGVVLHGSIDGMRPAQALEAVLPTCGLVHRLDGGILVIQAEDS